MNKKDTLRSVRITLPYMFAQPKESVVVNMEPVKKLRSVSDTSYSFIGGK